MDDEYHDAKDVDQALGSRLSTASPSSTSTSSVEMASQFSIQPDSNVISVPSESLPRPPTNLKAIRHNRNIILDSDEEEEDGDEPQVVYVCAI